MSEKSLPGAETLMNELFLSQEVTQKCLSWHDRFDERWVDEKGQRKESFHNAEHIRATLVSARLLVEAARTGNDPLGIIDDLKKWNQRHPDIQIMDEELGEVTDLAFGCHDLGNIAKGVILEDSGVKLDFLDAYRAVNAEERAQDIAAAIIQNSGLEEDKKRRYIPLVRHLINETKYMFGGEGENAPFARFMRVVDQIGNDLFSKNANRIIGLLEEMREEDPEAKFVAYTFFNFPRVRFPQLEASEENRSAVLKIWHRELPKVNPHLPKKEQIVKDWVEQYLARERSEEFNS